VIPPLLVFAGRPDSPVLQRLLAILASVGVGYILLGLGDYSSAHICSYFGSEYHPRSGIFHVLSSLLFGWITSGIYTGLCLWIWGKHHRLFVKETMGTSGSFKFNMIQQAIMWLAKSYLRAMKVVLPVVVIMLVISHFFEIPFLEENVFPLVGFLIFFFLLPLLPIWSSLIGFVC